MCGDFIIQEINKYSLHHQLNVVRVHLNSHPKAECIQRCLSDLILLGLKEVSKLCHDEDMKKNEDMLHSNLIVHCVISLRSKLELFLNPIYSTPPSSPRSKCSQCRVNVEFCSKLWHPPFPMRNIYIYYQPLKYIHVWLKISSSFMSSAGKMPTIFLLVEFNGFIMCFETESF